MRSADTVLDVRQIRRHAPDLGTDVTLRSYEGAVHDVHLSRQAVRRAAQRDLAAWLRGLRRRRPQAEAPGPATRSTAPP